MSKPQENKRIETWQVNASQTIVKGDVVVANSGKVDGGAAAASAGTVIGVANEDVTTSSSVDATDTIQVVVALADKEFAFTYEGSSKTTLAETDKGTKFDLASGSQNTVDLDDTTDGIVMCTGYDNDESLIIGTLQNRFYS